MRDIRLACKIEVKLLEIIKEIYDAGLNNKDYPTITINEEAFMIQINEIYNPPKFKKGNLIIIISGRFKDCTGVITDIDLCDKENPIMVRLDDNIDFNNCTCFVHYIEIEGVEHVSNR